jgi:23S rRNA pseudouridine1911/1915/1917 synthase
MHARDTTAEPYRTVIADRGDAGRRLDLVLRRHLRDDARATRTRVQAWIAAGHVRVNGRAVRRVAARTAVGDVVTIGLAGVRPRRMAAAEPIAIDVLYEDEWLLAVDKPPDMVVHPSYKHGSGTLLNALLWRAREWPRGARPSIVGRLDRLTSGVVIVAKTAAAHAALQRAMAGEDAEKNYLAVVYGRVRPARGTIDLRLAKDRRDRRMVVASAAAGAPSLTRFVRLACVAAPRAGLALVQCSLVTGRAHQIRAHMAARGWPIVGDPVYGEPRWRDVVDSALAEALRVFPRQALHARRVAFVHPVTHVRVAIEAALPQDFEELLQVSSLKSEVSGT